MTILDNDANDDEDKMNPNYEHEKQGMTQKRCVFGINTRFSMYHCYFFMCIQKNDVNDHISTYKPSVRIANKRKVK